MHLNLVCPVPCPTLDTGCDAHLASGHSVASAARTLSSVSWWRCLSSGLGARRDAKRTSISSSAVNEARQGGGPDDALSLASGQEQHTQHSMSWPG